MTTSRILVYICECFTRVELHVIVVILLQLIQYLYQVLIHWTFSLWHGARVNLGSHNKYCFGNVHPDVRYFVFSHHLKHRNKTLFDNLHVDDFSELGYAEAYGQTVQVVRFETQIQHLFEYVPLAPVWSKYLCQFTEILNRGNSYGVHAVVEPCQADGDKLFCKELLTKLLSECWILLHDR